MSSKETKSTKDPRPEISDCKLFTSSPKFLPESKSSQLIATFSPSVPFDENIGGLYPKRVVAISGIPKSDASRMHFNFVMNASRNIAFHMDVRFNYGVDRNVVVRNSKKEGGSWESEERSLPYFPFSPGTFFEMKITAEENYFQVDVNNKHVFDFFYRIPPLSFVDILQVEGDVTLTKVAY